MLPASARPGHLRALLVTLERLTLGRSARTSPSRCTSWPTAVRKRGMVVLISDLLDDPERVIEGLKHFRFRGTDVIVFHVLDPRRAGVSRSSARRAFATWRPARR